MVIWRGVLNKMHDSEEKKIVLEDCLYEEYEKLFFRYPKKINACNYKITDYKNSEKFLSIYYLYEFSDKIQFIIDNSQYPSLLNYVKTGILTEDEMIQALLYK